MLQLRIAIVPSRFLLCAAGRKFAGCVSLELSLLCCLEFDLYFRWRRHPQPSNVIGFDHNPSAA